jgi:hypothetical protein
MEQTKMKKIMIATMIAALGLSALAPARADEETDRQERIDALEAELQAERDQAQWDRLSDDINCGRITGWARGWFKHGKGTSYELEISTTD